MFLSGLTERSRFAVTLREAETQGQTPGCSFVTICWHSFMIARCDFMLIAPYAVFPTSADDPTFLSFKKGELIIIIKDGEFPQQRGWIMGENKRTKQKGAVPVDAILILPTLSRPTNEVMVWRHQRKLHHSIFIMGTKQGKLSCCLIVCFRVCSPCLQTRGKMSYRLTRKIQEQWSD